jgi:hypothetical protein
MRISAVCALRFACWLGLVAAASGCVAVEDVPLPDMGRQTVMPACIDRDGDGYGEGERCAGPDCDDDDPRVLPGAPELCDGRDNDCDGISDEGTADAPCTLVRGICASARAQCVDGAYDTCDGPDGPDLARYGSDFERDETRCDGLDNDCDGRWDEGCDCEEDAREACGGGNGECRAGMRACQAGTWGPCVGQIAPTNEVCDGLDNDCDERLDEEVTFPICPLNLGVCAGARPACGGDSGFLDCDSGTYGATYAAEETAEHCDGLDNDCDGSTDEACGCLPEDRQACGSAVGTCRQGTQTCDEGVFGACRGAREPAVEVCNGQDDDCDGTTDEALSPPACAQNLGVCAGAVARCAGGGFQPCGFEVYVAHDAHYVATETAAHCDGFDNDCNGRVDEACDCIDGEIQACGENRGVCTEGLQTCLGGRFGACTGVMASAETCDNQDNDCDGRVDEEVSGPQCPLQAGLCANARQLCVNGALATCDAAAYGAAWQANETFCDTRDNDCDGRTDEGCDCVDNAMQRCGTEVGLCSQGQQTCIGGRFGECTGGVSARAETCDGRDEDCDGRSDEAVVLPPCPLQVGVCAGAVRACLGAGGFGADCGVAQYGPRYVATESAAWCDGDDNDCDGRVDEACACQPGGVQPVCGTDTGECRSGRLACDNGDFGDCEGSIAPVTEACNGLDDDCDARTDENLTPPSCPLQLGVCAAAVKVCGGVAGFADCTPGRGYPGSYGVEDGSAPTCDGLDNDCDGQIDEGCPPPPVVINEIFFDSVGADGPHVFIELFGPVGTRLDGWRLEAVNGADNQVYANLALSGRIPDGGWYLITTPTAIGVLGEIADLKLATADLQNGPDSLRLVQVNRVVDAVAYGAFAANQFPAGEGAPIASGATGTSVSRRTDGLDTGDNAADFEVRAVPTPRGSALPQLHLSLRWDLDDSDFDLHLQRTGGFFGTADDCYWGNRQPAWGPDGERGDPRLSQDNSTGFGPEFIGYVSPPAGRYLAQVDYYSAVESGPATATLKVFVGNVLRGTYVQRVEASAPFWAAVQIDVAADGTTTLGELQLLDAEPFDN